jgi:hypothetical protein
MDIKVGQLLEFVDHVNVDGRVVAPGTRARVGHILTEVMEPRLTLVLTNTDKPETLVVPHHVAGIHCRIVPEGS